MHLIAIGMNHQTAPIALRERAAIATEYMDEAIISLREMSGIKEAAILSTCNRTELYCLSENTDHTALIKWLSDYQRIDQKQLSECCYHYTNEAAVSHVFRVASGLDSLVLGEPQILGQMKRSFLTAQKTGSTQKVLNRLFQHTFSVAKQVRTETLVGAHAVSIAYTAVDLSKRLFADINQQTVLLIGAGETIELVARHFKQLNVKHMIVANRSLQRADAIAEEFGAQAISLAEMPNRLADADIVVSSTASTLPLLGKGAVERALKARKNRPLFLVDLAVPRDIEPEVNELQNAYLYSIDDLQSVVEENQNSRKQAAVEAEHIIKQHVVRFIAWKEQLQIVPSIVQLREQAQLVAKQAVDKAKKRLAAGDEAEQVLEQLARTLTNKYLHAPTESLRTAESEGDTPLIQHAQKLFKL